MTMVNFDLNGDLEMYVLARIKSGYATSKAEVIRTSLMKAKQEDEAALVARGVRFEMEKMKGKKWTPHAQLKKELGF